MLAIFSRNNRQELSSPRSPGVKRRLPEQTPEDEDFIAQILDNLYSSLPRKHRALVSEHLCAPACAIGYVESDRQQLATDSDGAVSVYFKGELENNPTDAEDAQYILEEYKRTWERATLLEPSPVMEVLGQLEGCWAFILYDKVFGRIVAARDSQGGEPLYWGTTMLSDGLLFASDRGLIEGECVDADDFPPGTVFVSNDFSTAGALTPIKPEGVAPPKELCRVESRNNLLPKVPSQSHIEAN